MDVAAADPAGANPDQHLVLTHDRRRHLHKREDAGLAEKKRFQRILPFVFSRTRITK